MTTEKFEFRTEVKQLLDLMIHSLYSHKEIFLRELISNASDAIDKARYASLTNGVVLDEAGEWKIMIAADKNEKTITVSDNGIGMTRDELVESLGTIAHSGTKQFLTALQSAESKDRPELIGQFGVGFYSAFMVADKVTVVSRKAGSQRHDASRWESTADGTYSIVTAEKDRPGTDVVLHLKKDETRYLEEYEIRNIVKTYSDYIEHPIVMETEGAKESELEKGKTYTVREETVLNSRKAIWLRDKSEISETDYHEFYRHLAHDSGDPARVIHYKAEGTSEFTTVLFIPAKAPFGIFFRDFKIGPRLYVKRVKIMDHCEELIPPYLRFIQGVVDSSDLPLNISREILQSNRQVEIIRKNITKKVLDVLAEMKKESAEKYIVFHKEFGKVLKEGIHYDFGRREQIADLLLFPSTKTSAGAYTSFQDYLGSMTEGQETIYYITGTNLEEVLRSPYLEVFLEKGIEVLIMLDDIDDLIMGSLGEYKGKKLKSVIKGEVSLDSTSDSARDEAKHSFERLFSLMKEVLKDDVSDVRVSGRLKDSPCCLVTDETGLDPNMEKLFRAMGQEVPASNKILEINASHPVVASLNAFVGQEDKKGLLSEYVRLLYGQALLMEGSKPKDPSDFTRSVTRLILENSRNQQQEK